MTDFVQNLRAIRQDLHQHPELGFQEIRTKAKIAGYLRDLGLEVYEGAGVVGILKSGTGNRAIGLRADIDALPIQESSTHNYLSKNSGCLLYTSPSPRDLSTSRMPSSA